MARKLNRPEQAIHQAVVGYLRITGVFKIRIRANIPSINKPKS